MTNATGYELETPEQIAAFLRKFDAFKALDLDPYRFYDADRSGEDGE